MHGALRSPQGMRRCTAGDWLLKTVEWQRDTDRAGLCG
jgi:hypothetical protein